MTPLKAAFKGARLCRIGVCVVFVYVCILFIIPTNIQAQTSAPSKEHTGYCDHYTRERQVFYGDTHVHTSLSFDAVLWDTRNTPMDAYRFAKGERLGVSPYNPNGVARRTMKLERPLDFAMTSDHAEGLGLVELCKNPLMQEYNSMFCRMLRRQPALFFYQHLMIPLVAKELSKREDHWKFLPKLLRAEKREMICGKEGASCIEATRSPWRRIQDAAHIAQDNSPACTFTAFVGYEWTGYTQANIHRNVMFRNEHVIPFPISYHEVKSAPLLWEVLERNCTGECEVITIPHNSNVSLGLMFPTLGHKNSYNFSVARLSHKYDKVVEIMQHKGDSECWYGGPSTEDELCSFEKLPFNTLGAEVFRDVAYIPEPSDGYVRYTLKEGLKYYEKWGINPWQVGIIASTDNHLGTPGTVDEHSHITHAAVSDFIPSLSKRSILKDSINFNPGGLAAVWAEENTRDSIFDAFKRGEVYGTSGPRIQLRFFGGFNYAKNMCDASNKIDVAYQDGVPMGGVLSAKQLPSPDQSPIFLVHAVKDAGTESFTGTSLQRIQIVKAWLDSDGQTHEYVYDVQMAEDSDKASVNTDTCERTGEGASEMCVVWTDHSFDSKEHAWYYARAVENPSCRWSQYACNAVGVDCSNIEALPPKFAPCCAGPNTIQERAWSSPIWYYAH